MNLRSTLPRLPRIGPAALLWFSLLLCAILWGTSLAGEAEDATVKKRRPYATPKLVYYGSVSDLTSSGSTGMPEGAFGPPPGMP